MMQSVKPKQLSLMGYNRRWAFKAIAGLYYKLPIVLPVFVAIYGILLVTLAILHAYSTVTVVTMGLISSFVTVALVAKISLNDHIKSYNEHKIFLTVLIIYVFAWLIVGALNIQHNVFTYRDAAVYSVSAKYIASNAHVTTPGYLKAIENVAIDTGNFYKNSGSDISYHGLSLLSSYGAAATLLTNDFNAFRINVALAAVALLALYFLGSLMIRPFIAFAMTVIFSITLPFIYFSRDMYTEILAIIFSVASLYLIMMSLKKPTRRLWFLAGLILGASALTRIDALLFIAPVLGYVLYVTNLATAKKRYSFNELKYFFIGLFISLSIAVLNLVYLSNQYMIIHKKYIFLELLMLVIIAILSILATKVIKRNKLRLNKQLLKKLAIVAVIGLMSIVIILLLRNIWFPSKDILVDFRLIGGREVVLSNPQDGVGVMYNKSEPVIMWIASYLGLLASLFSLAGLLYALFRAVTRKDRKLALLIASFVPVTLAYMVYPAITADHIWAIRRFLPVTLPILIIFLGIFAQRGYDYYYQRYNNKAAILFIITVAITSLVSVGSISAKYILTPLNQGGLSQMSNICKSLPDNATLVWGGSMGMEAVHTTMAYCGIDSVRLDDYSAQSLSEVAIAVRLAGKVPFIGYAAPQNLYDNIASENLSFVDSLQYPDAKMQLYKAPSSFVTSERSILIGEINSDGSVYPL